MPDLYEDVFKVLEHYDNEGNCFSDGQEELIGYVRAYTGISEEQAKLIVELFFKEIQSALLRGDEVSLTGIGKIHSVNPAKARKNKNWFHVYPRFTAFKTLTNKINI